MKFKGKVMKGLEVGAKFGIATANIEIKDKELDLKEGVYFVYVRHKEVNEVFISEKKYNGILHFGKLKTFGRSKTCEVHLFDFDKNIYGEILEIEVLKFHREIQKFQNADALYTQIEKDLVIAEKYFMRKDVYRKWEKVSDEEREIFQKESLEKIEKIPEFLSSKNIFIYAPQRKREVDFTEELMKKFPEKKYFFPKILEKNEMRFFQINNYKNLVKGKYNILEPEKSKKISKIIPDIIFLPAVAADFQNNRLGKGGGFYDRYLEDIISYKICVLPEFAIYEKIPVEAHDQKIDKLVII